MSSTRVLLELVIVLGTAAVITVVCQVIHVPVVLGYVAAGLVIGPHVPFPLVADAHLVHLLSELGVILLMFTIGLELRISTLLRVGISAGLTALFEVGLAMTIGALVARLLGFSGTESIFVGACLGISSTMIVAKTFEELGWKGKRTETAFAILVFEDLIAIVLLAVLGGIATGGSGPVLGTTLAKLAAFLAVSLVVGLLTIPRLVRWIAGRARPETLAIFSLAFCFGMAAVAAQIEFSVALGAFLAGILVSESGKGHDVFELVRSIRDVFAMIFFVSIGMQIVPGELLVELPTIAVLTFVVLLIKPLGVALGVFGAGHGVSDAVRTGLALGQIGELSFVIAGIGVTSGATRSTLLAIAAGVACTTAIASSVVIPRSDRIASWLAARLPKKVATFASFYESWIDKLRARPPGAWKKFRWPIAVLVLDVAAVAVLAILGITFAPRVADYLALEPVLARTLTILAACGLAVPFAIGAVRRVAQIARMLAYEIIPGGQEVDLGASPRRALVLTFALAIGVAALIPFVVVTSPVLPGAAALVPIVVISLGLVARRAIGDFEGHVRAGSEVILELLVHPQTETNAPSVETVLPGFGAVVSIPISASSPAVGRSLAELDLRAKTGASVLAIARGDHGMVMPSPTEPLQAGDVLAMAGGDPAIAAARELLSPP